MRDHDPITIREFLGTYDRGDDDTVPPGYFKDSRNVRFITGGVESREGSTLDTSIPSVKRMAVYKRIGEAQRLLILRADGNLYDSTNLSTPILSIAAMTDFSMVVMFNRAYITPHNGQTGLPGESVYVYEGSGVARVAGGTGPTASPGVSVAEGAAGNFDSGIHLFAVAYETQSGFITQPGAYKAFFSALPNFKKDISNIPVGPSGTAARILLGTKDVSEGDPGIFDGDFINKDWFFIPNGRIAGNVTTTATVEYFDADLQSTADHLFDQLTTIPAGVGLLNYRGRLLSWGEDLAPAIFRASVAGEPESHDAVEGFGTVNPGDSGGGIRACAEYRNQLVICKAERTYVTQDNDQPAAFWEIPSTADAAYGTECHGIGKIRDYGDNLQDIVFVASRPGFQMYRGTFANAEFSDAIQNIWDRITEAYFHTLEVAVDPHDARVYAALPLDGATAPNYLLVGDFQEGLDKFKWTLWTFAQGNPQTIVVDVDDFTRVSIFKFGVLSGNVHRLDRSLTLDNGVAIDHWIQFPHLPLNDDGMVYHFTGIRLRAKGSGNLDITVSGMDAVQTINPSAVVLTPAPGRELFRGFNFVNEKASVKLRMDAASETFRLTKMVLFGKIEWETRPDE